MRARACVAAIAALLLRPSVVGAQEVASDAAGAVGLTLRTSLKTSGLAFRTPDAPDIFPERTGGESVSRLRLEPEVTLGSRSVFVVAYEQQLRYRSAAAGIATSGILPTDGAAPFRIRALDWTITSSSHLIWRHEIDRASVRLHRDRADITVGRQAIGWGRGVMFGAVDLFAPFSPLEADREWRRGVDAVRADIKVTDRSSIDAVGAFGRTLDQSAFAARLRGYAGPIDVEVMGGRRGRDGFAGATTSAAVGDAEVHGELAAFRVDEPALGPGIRVIMKAVAGGSFRLPVGAGILTYVEYHYSGFGATRPEEILPLLSTPALADRYIRGDTQILSRHAVGVTALYDMSPEVSLSGQWIENPKDRSGVAAPGVTYTFGDRASVLGSVYLPYGRRPRGVTLHSEYGAASVSALFQLRLYF
jgi:hypothetical protein